MSETTNRLAPATSPEANGSAFTSVSFLYRCRRCGAIERNPHIGIRSKDTLVAVVHLCDAMHEKPGAEIGMLSLHSCAGNCCGIADLIGFEPDQPDIVLGGKNSDSPNAADHRQPPGE